MKETNYTDSIKEKFKKAGWLVHKTSERFVAGWPDLLVVKRGTTVFIEVKVKKNPLSILQQKTLVDLAKAGALALVMRKQEDGVEILYRVMPTGDYVNLTGKLNVYDIKAVQGVL